MMKTRFLKLKNLTLTFLVIFGFLSSQSIAQSPVTIKLDAKNASKTIPSDFCGLSYEIKLVLPDSATGEHYFNPGNKPLITTFKTLGIKHLRIGGNTAERLSVNIPNKTDIDSLFAFAKLAGVKVIYTVRMANNTPEAAAEIVKYIMDKYEENVSCFIVGNEPDKDYKYPQFLEEWKKFTSVIVSPKYAPAAKFLGPATTGRAPDWARNLANDMGKSGLIAMIGQHDYPGKSGRSVKDQAKARADMLSPAWLKHYQEFHDIFVPAVLSNGLIFRLNETNSFSNGGALGASDTYTSSLWTLDYLYWWAYNDASGLNFHTGQKVLPGSIGPNRPNVYTAFTSSENGYTILPTGYGMKMFDLGSRGKLVPVSIISNSDSINVRAYSTLSPDKKLYVTFINKEFGTGGHSADVTIETDLSLTRGEIISLTSPTGDISVISGTTIGGASFKEDGTWNGVWTPFVEQPKNGRATIHVPAATAVIVQFYEE
jgi:hypothetical protein